MDPLTIPSVVFSFISLSRTTDMTLALEGEGIGAYNELMLVFAKEKDEANNKVTCSALNQNTPDLRTKISEYIDKYKDKNPKIQKLGDYFKDLDEGEMFFFFPSPKALSFMEYERLFDYLVSLRDGVSYETVVQQTADLFGNLRTLYEIKAYGNVPINIGEPDKKKRVCRFCGKDATQTKFQNKAHTISKSLGNNLIVTNDECDTCNNEFGKTVESDFADYLGVFRTMMGLRGYNGIPHIKGENFDIKQENDQVKLNFHAKTKEEEDTPIENMRLQLRSKQKIKLQNVYRSIVKYALSVTDTSEMSHFQDTIEWIFGRKVIPALPRIALMAEPSFYNKQPQIITYKRTADDRMLPYLVTEFHFGHLVFVAIVPSCDMDDADFTQSAYYDYFWTTFKHFSANKGWEFKDFSSDVDNTFITNLNIRQGR